MVKLVLILIGIIYTTSSIKAQDEPVILTAGFEYDSVCMGDTLELKLVFSNKSNDTYRLTPRARIGLVHSRDNFIIYANPERIAYSLYGSVYKGKESGVCYYPAFNSGKTVYLKPGEDFVYYINVFVKPGFFYLGDNLIEVYSSFDDIVKTRKKRKLKTRTVLSTRSSPIKLKVIGMY